MSFSYFTEFSFLVFSFRAYFSVSPFCLTFYACFYGLGRTAESFNLEGMVLCMVVPYADCMCGVTGWQELWLVWAGSALVGWPQLKWTWAAVALRFCGSPGRTAEAEGGES